MPSVINAGHCERPTPSAPHRRFWVHPPAPLAKWRLPASVRGSVVHDTTDSRVEVLLGDGSLEVCSKRTRNEGTGLRI